jgi:hypothetical protein
MRKIFLTISLLIFSCITMLGQDVKEVLLPRINPLFSGKQNLLDFICELEALKLHVFDTKKGSLESQVTDLYNKYKSISKVYASEGIGTSKKIRIARLLAESSCLSRMSEYASSDYQVLEDEFAMSRSSSRSTSLFCSENISSLELYRKSNNEFLVYRFSILCIDELPVDTICNNTCEVLSTWYTQEWKDSSMKSKHEVIINFPSTRRKLIVNKINENYKTKEVSFMTSIDVLENDLKGRFHWRQTTTYKDGKTKTLEYRLRGQNKPKKEQSIMEKGVESKLEKDMKRLESELEKVMNENHK